MKYNNSLAKSFFFTRGIEATPWKNASRRFQSSKLNTLTLRTGFFFEKKLSENAYLPPPPQKLSFPMNGHVSMLRQS
jgi:hypothetical protein